MNLEQTPKEKMQANMRTMMQDVLAEMNAGKSSGMTMTAKEKKFFAAISTDVGTKNPEVLPEETINEVFDALTEDHPFLATLSMQNTGLRMKLIKANTAGTAVWGEIFGDINGQLDADFVTEDDLQNKLTAFIALPKDMSDFGPDWIKKFVITQLTEAMSVALEEGFMSGDGQKTPTGLMMDLTTGKVIDKNKVQYSKKPITGVIDFSDHTKVQNAIAEIAQRLSMTINGKMLKPDNSLSLALNPSQYEIIRGAFTVQNASGVYVEAYPLGIKVVPAMGVPFGQAVAYRASRYVAAIGGALNIQQYDQTLAMNDMDLYVAKQFANGEALDNNVSAIYEIILPKVITNKDGNVPVAGVDMSQQSATIKVGATRQVTATVSPSDATNTKVAYASSNDKVATVADDGTITAVAEGSATITATTEDGGFKATVAVTVTAAA